MFPFLRNGIYPLTAFAQPLQQRPTRSQVSGSDSRVLSPAEQQTSHEHGATTDDETNDEHYVETRRVVSMSAEVKPSETVANGACSVNFWLGFYRKLSKKIETHLDLYDAKDGRQNESPINGGYFRYGYARAFSKRACTLWFH